MKSIEFIAEIGGNFTTPSEGIKLVDAAKKSGATSKTSNLQSRHSC